MSEVLLLHLFWWHLERQIKSLQLQEDFRLVMAVVARRLKLLRPVWPTRAEFKEAQEAMWALRSFSLGRLLDAFQLWPQIDVRFKQEVKTLVDHAREGII